MSQVEEEEPKNKENWTENDLKEAVRRINAGEINFKEAEDVYGISPRTIHRRRAIENMRAQLNPEKAKKMKSGNTSGTKKDVTILRKPVEISCSTINDVVNLLKSGTEEIKQLLSHECDIIYECKVCKNLFRSLVNFISHKRIYCCNLYSVIHTQSDENEDDSEANELARMEDKLKIKDNFKEFTAKPFRITCRKDLTSVLKRITAMSDLIPSEPILHLQSMENAPCAFQEVILSNQISDVTNTNTSYSYESNENYEILPEADKKEASVIPGKTCEKSTHNEKHVNFVAEKRFRCPVCHSNFTIKKSVMRHLKSVHNKSVEQLERLKSRIQMHFVRIKSNTNENNKQQQEDKSQTAIVKTNPEQIKNNWVKKCAFCSRQFINKYSYAAHVKVCKKNTLFQAENSEQNTSKNPISLVPVISLTPIATTSLASKIETTENKNSKLISNQSKKNASVVTSPNSKKVSLPLTAVSPQSKKIGIQVRMNYCKENSVNQSNNINGTALINTASTSVTVPQWSNDSSSKNSLISMKDVNLEKNDSEKVKLLSNHFTRSTSKLATILESLFDKHSTNNENPKNLDKHELCGNDLYGNEEFDSNVKIKVEKNEVTIYCEECGETFALNDISSESTAEERVRNYRCALRNCDFQSSNICELLPHLSARHAVLSENELSEIKSVFIAESCQQNGAGNRCFCSKKKHEIQENNLENKHRTENVIQEDAKNTAISDHNSSTVESKISKNIMNVHNISSKRKLCSHSTKQKIVKRKIIDEKKIVLKNDNHKLNETSDVQKNEKNVNNPAQLINHDDMQQNENSYKNELKISQFNEAQVLKKTKKIAQKQQAVTCKGARMKKSVPVNSSSETFLMNGSVTSSSDEESDKLRLSSKPYDFDNAIRKENDVFFDSKFSKTPQKINMNSFHSESSSAPDSDLDQSVMSDENLKKSIMTILFGKDITAEKVEESVAKIRDKSPASSSTSSECGREKRYSFRIAKQSNVKNTASLENKDEKLLKISNSNKTKPTSR